MALHGGGVGVTQTLSRSGRNFSSNPTKSGVEKKLRFSTLGNEDRRDKRSMSMLSVIPTANTVATLCRSIAASIVGCLRVPGNGTPSVMIITTLLTVALSPICPNISFRACRKAASVLVVPDL